MIAVHKYVPQPPLGVPVEPPTKAPASSGKSGPNGVNVGNGMNGLYRSEDSDSSEVSDEVSDEVEEEPESVDAAPYSIGRNGAMNGGNGVHQTSNDSTRPTATTSPNTILPSPLKCAWVTLLTRASYLPGLLVLADSFRQVRSAYPLVALCTPTLPPMARRILAALSIPTRDVESLKPPGESTISEHDRRFDDTWSKLRAFELEEYDRVVMLDSDMVIWRNMDELMALPLPARDWVAATHVCACNPRRLPHYPADWVPANCAHSSMVHPSCLTHPPAVSASSPRPYSQLNSGTVVLSPSTALAEEIYRFLHTSPMVATFKFPDQDLLSAVFRGRWQPLPYVYNALKTLRDCHVPMWRTEQVRCMHYVLDKPWASRKPADKRHVDLHALWWERWAVVQEQLREACSEEEVRFVEENVTE